MFTGLVQHVGKIISVSPTEAGARLLVDAAAWSHSANRGDSISVAGVCLTHAPGGGDPDDSLAFDVVPETLSRTRLGDLRGGDGVNLEACLTPSSPIGGHFVQGHVDGIGRVIHVHAGADGGYRLTIEVEPDLMPYMTPKGAVAVDGVSLTIAGIESSRPAFSVALIPTTLDLTTLGAAVPGTRVNVEADMMAKTIVNYLRRWSGQGPNVTSDEPGGMASDWQG